MLARMTFSRFLPLASTLVLGAGVVCLVHGPQGTAAPVPAAETVLKPATERARTGSGELVFENVPGWGELDDQSPIGPTHGGVAVDSAGNVYTSTDAKVGIRVFGPDGKQVRTMGEQFAGTHSLVLNREKDGEYLYGAHLRGNRVFKMKTDGTPALVIFWPEKAVDENGQRIYEKPTDYRVTAVAVAPDGSIFAADGYGKQYIHQFDAQGNYVKSFGGKGTEPGKFASCHGMGLDPRGEKPLLLVCDRENRRLQHFDLEGNFVVVTTTGLRRPTAVSFHGDYAAVTELEARVAILDKTNQVVAVLGDNPNREEWAKNPIPREQWKAAIFTAPHGSDWDAQGNLYVQDWNTPGRLTKLERVSAGTGSGSR